jgi:hypothetical protein
MIVKTIINLDFDAGILIISYSIDTSGFLIILELESLPKNIELSVCNFILS